MDDGSGFAFSEALEEGAVEVVELALVDAGEVGDDAGVAGGDAVEEPAGVDGGELHGVAEEDELAVEPVGLVDEPGEVAGGDHGGFVDDDRRCRRGGCGLVSRWCLEHGDGAGPDVRWEVVGEFAGGRGGGGDADDVVSCGSAGVGVGGDRVGLARAAGSGHGDEASVEVGEAADCGWLVRW